MSTIASKTNGHHPLSHQSSTVSAPRKAMTKTVTKMFRDQYMESFQIGRGKPKLRKKSSTYLEIEEAFGQEDLMEDVILGILTLALGR